MNQNPNHNRNPRCALRGFTLVELMVTITIIAVLVALSLFGYMKFRDTGAKAASVNNLRQLQIANAGYASDNNGRFVAGFGTDLEGRLTQWDRNLDYLVHLRGQGPLSKDGRSDVPTNLLDPKALRTGGRNRDVIRGSYGILNVVGAKYREPGEDSSVKMVQITAPERTAAFVTALDWRITYGGRLSWDGTEGPYGRGMIAYRHDGKALVVYYDGHVGEISKADMAKMDENGGGDHPFWKARP